MSVLSYKRRATIHIRFPDWEKTGREIVVRSDLVPRENEAMTVNGEPCKILSVCWCVTEDPSDRWHVYVTVAKRKS